MLRIFNIPKIADWFYPKRIWFGKKPALYLTFDDGPHPEITPWLLDFFKKNNLKATFFWLGENIEKYPNFLHKASADGHVVAYHGYSHVSSEKLSFEEFTNNSAFPTIKEMKRLFRPPYGILSKKRAKYLKRESKIVMWSWMSYDYDKTVGVDYILQKGKKQIQPGDILLFHENDKTKERIKEILPPLIHYLKEKGLTFATLSND